jgi:flavin reductase (DIM6/NTAB) family NADH-FMN oxidoreductase RutF
MASGNAMGMSELVLDGAHDSRVFRNALGRFATGVTVITTHVNGRREGLTANSFSALSLDPPLVLWSIVRKSPSAGSFLAAGQFAINVLAASQSALSHHFATPHDDKFEGIDVLTGLGDIPLVQGALASFECRTEQTIDGGDHILFVGRVQRIRYADGDPLIFSSGRYCTALPMRSLTATSDMEAVWAGLG